MGGVRVELAEVADVPLGHRGNRLRRVLPPAAAAGQNVHALGRRQAARTTPPRVPGADIVGRRTADQHRRAVHPGLSVADRRPGRRSDHRCRQHHASAGSLVPQGPRLPHCRRECSMCSRGAVCDLARGHLEPIATLAGPGQQYRPGLFRYAQGRHYHRGRRQEAKRRRFQLRHAQGPATPGPRRNRPARSPRGRVSPRTRRAKTGTPDGATADQRRNMVAVRVHDARDGPGLRLPGSCRRCRQRGVQDPRDGTTGDNGHQDARAVSPVRQAAPVGYQAQQERRCRSGYCRRVDRDDNGRSEQARGLGRRLR